MSLIPLGFHCNVSHLNQHIYIKKETFPFEWFQSNKLQYITDLIITLKNNPEENVIYEKDKILYLINNGFFSRHYKLDEFNEIFKRRYKRFLEIIKTEKTIYFVRINTYNNNTSNEEVECFIKIIKEFNPQLIIKFLLIDTIENENDFIKQEINLDNVIFHHKFFLKRTYGFYGEWLVSKNEELCNIYEDMLGNIGYSVLKNKNFKKFDDKS